MIMYTLGRRGSPRRGVISPLYKFATRGVNTHKGDTTEPDKGIPPSSNDGSTPDVEGLLVRYKNLGTKDKVHLITTHLRNIKDADISTIYNFVREKKPVRGMHQQEHNEPNEHERKRKIKILKIQKPPFMQQRSSKKTSRSNLSFKNDYNSDEYVECLEKEKELKGAEQYTLVEDLYKAYIYSRAFTTLSNQYRTKHTISNDFLHVMIRAIRSSIMERVNPTLVNEFANFKNPYMLMKHAFENFILHGHVKNPYEESLISEHLKRKTYLNVLKLDSAEVPVEVYEPLASFRGDVHYNYDVKEKFASIIRTQLDILGVIAGGETHAMSNSAGDDATDNEGASTSLNTVLRILPENACAPFENYPFDNLKALKTQMRKRYMGGIKNSKPINVEDEELSHMRYPNLQSVAHSLPSDSKYRANVIHAIKVLERSKHWDHASKIKAINTLVDVWNNMHASDHYENLMDKCLPVIYTKDMLRKTKTRRDTYNRGLVYVQSLTTQKPLGARQKKG
ncbi:conserved Plasmodium protein, unknown function [Plasmodium knowlesi strain H]|uniref:Uncharacterized protein n=3 Tax=Plasmodium knowlesi TaxID=5850 RepID=A0A5K1UE47_PLAKH|nr:uncharacterized protein PKNH_0609200 [Plasmodium knowlesi strain H]OTN68190.1 Uncharacterized protein PKNOH_S03324000 [Plasmodium knowlesi]CAA9987142.1 conserved protein, unknown function [Plasmodium knowlesi strain H]SBO23895.1 conserved Plasmodium protein, unknown function [Plasmodium knowlesi strain H]SBO25741.1 conserved Plasmodium protein, unknown function [Plasmodium knowlesi strain H]VVS76616.1 conserved protein, unknown function [Plasmodium knowlesi strain H]|eukprot:XP_002261764.1 [Plasmodium knowlesi strain H]